MENLIQCQANKVLGRSAGEKTLPKQMSVTPKTKSVKYPRAALHKGVLSE
jgi:hypothetical protein